MRVNFRIDRMRGEPVPQGRLIVARYEVPGNEAKKKCPSRQGRSKRWALGFASDFGSANSYRSSTSGRIGFKKTRPGTSYRATFKCPSGTCFLGAGGRGVT
jgi:hypothetical protein